MGCHSESGAKPGEEPVCLFSSHLIQLYSPFSFYNAWMNTSLVHIDAIFCVFPQRIAVTSSRPGKLLTSRPSPDLSRDHVLCRVESAVRM
jgi:hypothetical protein